MNAGDEVVVRNLDDEEAHGVVEAVLDEEVDEAAAPFLDPDGATLLDYWRGAGVPADDRVVRVDLGAGVYDYPESRVEVVDD
jgi:hypothetical protein